MFNHTFSHCFSLSTLDHKCVIMPDYLAGQSHSCTLCHFRPRRASFGSKDAIRGGDSVTHQLTKKLQHLKKKIKQFEEQFEKERNYKVTRIAFHQDPKDSLNQNS